MTKRAFTAFFAFVLICLFAAGCNRKNAVSSDTGMSGMITAPPLLDVDITGLVTSDQVTKALGVTVGEAQVIEESTAVRYYSEDSMSYAEISMLKCSRAKFDDTVMLYQDAADTSNLGQAAKWSADSKQLLVYSGNYMISVTAAVTNKSNDALLTSARQIAALVLEKVS